MNDKLLKKYLAYANTDEAKAVLFVKKYMEQTSGQWIDIINYERYEQSDDPLHFRFVECGLYKRTLKPKYPPQSEFTHNDKFDKNAYYLAIRAITWETSHRDIEKQKSQGVIGIKYLLTGVRYNKNNEKYKSQPPWLNPTSAFYGNPPSSFRWRDRKIYEYDPEWVYEFKNIKKLT